METDPLQIAGIPQLESWSTRLARHRSPPAKRGSSKDRQEAAEARKIAAQKKKDIAEQIKPPAIVEKPVEIVGGFGINVHSSGSKHVISMVPKEQRDVEVKVEVPIGGIIMYSGTEASIQMPWALCNGGAYGGVTTPDLRDRFVVAGSSYEDGVWKSTVEDPAGTAKAQTGGAKTHTHGGHTISDHDHDIQHKHHVEDHGHEIPDHAHGITSTTYQSGLEYDLIASCPATTDNDGGGGGVTGGTDIYTDSLLANEDPYGEITKSGPGGADSLSHDSRVHIPPYYALAFIMRVQ